MLPSALCGGVEGGGGAMTGTFQGWILNDAIIFHIGKSSPMC